MKVRICVALGLALTGAPLRAARLTLQPAVTVMGVDGAGWVNALYDDDDDGPHPPVRVTPSSVTWVSSLPGVVQMNAVKKGNYDALAEGVSDVSGTYLGLTATATVRVAGRVISSSIVTPADGRTRTYLVFRPSGYNPAVPHPLILSFHGGGGSAAIQMSQSQILPLAERETILVAYPDGTGAVQTWNGGACCGYASSNTVDDVGFVRALVARLKTDYAVDPARIYSTGMSNGGILSHRLACEATDLFAAIAPVAGGLNLGGDFSACRPSRQIPVLHFHGTTDDNYPYLGGVGNGLAGVSFYPIPDTMDDWLRLNGIPGNARVIYQKGIETCAVHTGFPNPVQVGLCLADPPFHLLIGSATYDGGGHAWPGGIQPSATSDAPTMDANAAELMWTFFEGLVPVPAPSVASGRVYPSPFRFGSGAMVFDQLPSDARIQIVDLKGSRIAELTADAGGRCVWDVKTSRGDSVSSGLYFAQISGPGGVKRIKIAIQQ